MDEHVRPEVLISRLMSDNETWRVDAEARLVALGAEAVGPLTAAMRHASPAVRLHAVHALAVIGDPRGVPVLVKALEETENHAAVAIASEKALVAWGAPARPALVESARNGPAAIRPRVLRTLGAIGGAELEPLLVGFLQDPGAGVRLQAAAALASVAGERAIDRIVPLLEDADPDVRFSVAETLVKLGSARGEAVLLAVRDDPENQGQHARFWAEELLDQLEELRRTGQVRP